jgi:hypothetical protein
LSTDLSRDRSTFIRPLWAGRVGPSPAAISRGHLLSPRVPFVPRPLAFWPLTFGPAHPLASGPSPRAPGLPVPPPRAPGLSVPPPRAPRLRPFGPSALRPRPLSPPALTPAADVSQYGRAAAGCGLRTNPGRAGGTGGRGLRRNTVRRGAGVVRGDPAARARTAVKRRGSRRAATAHRRGGPRRDVAGGRDATAQLRGQAALDRIRRAPRPLPHPRPRRRALPKPQGQDRPVPRRRSPAGRLHGGAVSRVVSAETG